MIRPEAAAALRRWAEPVAGGGLVALGLWWIGDPGILAWIGGAMVVLGAALLYTGSQRLRMSRLGPGPGVLRLDEGRLLYMGPREGGAADLASLRAVTLDPDGPAWVLQRPEAEGGPLRVPMGALGAPAMLDALAALPGFDADRALAALREPPAAPLTIWRAETGDEGTDRGALPPG